MYYLRQIEGTRDREYNIVNSGRDDKYSGPVPARFSKHNKTWLLRLSCPALATNEVDKVVEEHGPSYLHKNKFGSPILTTLEAWDISGVCTQKKNITIMKPGYAHVTFTWDKKSKWNPLTSPVEWRFKIARFTIGALILRKWCCLMHKCKKRVGRSYSSPLKVGSGYMCPLFLLETWQKIVTNLDWIGKVH